MFRTSGESISNLRLTVLLCSSKIFFLRFSAIIVSERDWAHWSQTLLKIKHMAT